MRKLAAVAAAVAAVVVLYAAAGTWLAPRLLRAALVDAAAQQGLALELAAVRSNPFRLALALEGIELRGPQGRALAAARAAQVDLSWSSLWHPAWIFDRVRIEQPSLDAAALAAGGGGGGGGELPPIFVHELLIEQGSLQDFAVHDLSIRAQDLSTRDGALGRYELAARLAGAATGEIRSSGAVSLAPLGLRDASIEGHVAPRGTFTVRGDLDLQPLRGALDVVLEAMPLAPAQRWVPARIASGALTAKGVLHVSEQTASYRGSAALRGLRLEERESGALLLAWQLASTDALRLGLAPVSVEVGELTVRAPEGRLVIAQDGSTNFSAALPKGGGSGDRFRAVLNRLTIEDGTLHFADRSLPNPFEVTLRELSGSVAGFSTDSGETARVRLAGRVEPFGSARIRGTIDPQAPTALADVRASLRNLQLEAFNPYIAKFAGYRIASGRLSADLRYELRDRRLVGTNRLVFERIQLGEKLEAKGMFDLPLELAVALLADAEGRINLDIPVRGSLNDPQFDLGTIMARAFGNVLKRVVSAPFRALTRALGGGRDAGAVAFDPGSAALTPPAEEELARIARALEERPRLAIEVRAGFDATRDPRALRVRAARDEVARAAGVKGVPDLSDPKMVRAAERLYLRRGGDRATLAELRKDEPRYVRALLTKLAETVPGDAAALEPLAQARAQAVRSALLEHGVAEARVRVAPPSEQQAGDRGVPTELALVAG